MDSNTPDWEISKLYSQAFAIVKKFKLLWIMGLAAAGSSFNFRNSGNFNSQDFQKLFNNPNTPQKSTEAFSQVLGASTSPFLESVKGIFGSIPFYFYLLLGLEFLILIVTVLVVSIIYSSWAQGLLIQSSFDASKNQKVSIGDASSKVLAKLRSLIWLQFVPGLLFFLASLLVFGFLGILIALLPGFSKAIPIILLIIAIGSFIYWLIYLSIIQIWAPRQVLDKNQAGKEAFFASFKIARKKFWPSIALGAVNNILALFVIGVPVAILVGIVVAGVFGAHSSPALGLVLIIIGIPLIIAAVVGFMLLGGALNAFKAVVWTLAYENIKGKYDS